MKTRSAMVALLLGLCITFSMYSDKKEEKRMNYVTAQPEENKVYPLAIIGAGAGGTMATQRAVLNNREVLLFTGAKQEKKRSRGHWVRTVDNIPGLKKYKRALVELQQETLREIAEGPFKHNLYVIEDSVIAIEKSENVFKLSDNAGHTYLARHVILATGMMDEQPHINGSIRPILRFANNQSIAYCLLCDGHRSFQKKTVVIGHSDEAGKAALLLANRYQPSKLTILTNGQTTSFTDETQALLLKNHIDIASSPINEICKDDSEMLTGFLLHSTQTVEADIGFVSLGIRPNNGLALALNAKVDDKGLVVASEKGETSVPNLFVIGDLRSGSMKQIYTAWQQATEAVQVIDRRIREE